MLLNCEIKEGKTRSHSTNLHVIDKKNKESLQNVFIIYDRQYYILYISIYNIVYNIIYILYYMCIIYVHSQKV